MIKKIIKGNEVFEYPVFLFEYLYSYLFRFGIKNGIFDSKGFLIIKDAHIDEFYKCVERALKDLLDSCYEEPSQKNKSKHGSRYQKIKLQDKFYFLNFRTDPVGNTAYGIYLLLNWIDKNRTIQIDISEEE